MFAYQALAVLLYKMESYSFCHYELEPCFFFFFFKIQFLTFSQ